MDIMKNLTFRESYFAKAICYREESMWVRVSYQCATIHVHLDYIGR